MNAPGPALDGAPAAEPAGQHERVTKADRALQERLARLLRSPDKVSHLIAARAAGPQQAPDRNFRQRP